VNALARIAEPETQARLVFAHGGGATFLREQSAPYPFHLTRPHRLDPGRPDIATVYLQSASGGLYRGDRLRLALEARPGAVAHVTSQAATVAHRTAGRRIDMQTRLEVHAGATLALTTDPVILFPDCALTTGVDVVLHPGARALVAEGFATHDPRGEGRPFAGLATSARIRAADGRTLVQERAVFTGEDFGRPGVLGGFAAFGSAFVLGGDIDPQEAETRLDGLGVLAGASPLPNGAGWGVRMLAGDGGALARGLDALFALAFASLTGVAPGRRRK
jgi:urease accessory protein